MLSRFGQRWKKKLTDLESRGTATAFVISPGFARFQDALWKFCMLMSDLTDRAMPVAISGYDLPVDEDFRTGFWDQGRAMACLSWAVKPIKGLEAYQLTLQDDMYYDHGLLLTQRIEIHHRMHADQEAKEQLKKAVVEAFKGHGLKGVRLVETHRRSLLGKTQELSKRVEAVPQSACKKRGENPPMGYCQHP